MRYGFFPPPNGTCISRYDVLLDIICDRDLLSLEGDVVEVGAFLGGGTYCLSKLCYQHTPDKKVIAVDVFEPDSDDTPSACGHTMCELYRRLLDKRKGTQWEVFQRVTAGLKNVVVVREDSALVELPCERICFAYIDGNHAFDYVVGDFELVWRRLVHGGVVVFDDYPGLMASVRRGIHHVVGVHGEEIGRIETLSARQISITKA